MRTLTSSPQAQERRPLGADREADCPFGQKPTVTYWRKSVTFDHRLASSTVAESYVMSISVMFAVKKS